VQLRHGTEVHPVDGAHQRRGEEDRRPGRDLLDLLVLALADQRALDGQPILEQRPQRVGPLDDADDVVVHVTQIVLEIDVAVVLVEPHLERGQHAQQRMGGCPDRRGTWVTALSS
jgi:hypothetical protein